MLVGRQATVNRFASSSNHRLESQPRELETTRLSPAAFRPVRLSDELLQLGVPPQKLNQLQAVFRDQPAAASVLLDMLTEAPLLSSERTSKELNLAAYEQTLLSYRVLSGRCSVEVEVDGQWRSAPLREGGSREKILIPREATRFRFVGSGLADSVRLEGRRSSRDPVELIAHDRYDGPLLDSLLESLNEVGRAEELFESLTTAGAGGTREKLASWQRQRISETQLAEQRVQLLEEMQQQLGLSLELAQSLVALGPLSTVRNLAEMLGGALDKASLVDDLGTHTESKGRYEHRADPRPEPLVTQPIDFSNLYSSALKFRLQTWVGGRQPTSLQVEVEKEPGTWTPVGKKLSRTEVHCRLELPPLQGRHRIRFSSTGRLSLGHLQVEGRTGRWNRDRVLASTATFRSRAEAATLSFLDGLDPEQPAVAEAMEFLGQAGLMNLILLYDTYRDTTFKDVSVNQLLEDASRKALLDGSMDELLRDYLGHTESEIDIQEDFIVVGDFHIPVEQ